MKWLILALGIASSASASVLVKLAIIPPREFPSITDPIAALNNWPFWLGLTFYGGVFLLYVSALEKLPLNIVHPILTSGSVAAVTLISFLIFREPLDWLTGIGILLVIAGVALITASAV